MISSYISQYIYIYTYLVCCLYLHLSMYTYRYMSYVGSIGVIPRWVSLQGLQNGVLHALARICWSEWLKSTWKKLWELLWSYFCLGQEPNLTNKPWNVCVLFHVSLGNPTFPSISVPPLCFQAGKTSMKSIIFANYHSRDFWQFWWSRSCWFRWCSVEKMWI